MPRYSLQKLPSNFRYFFTLKEIKGIESRMEIKFDRISTGHITESGHFDKEARIQSSFRALSVSAWQEEDSWRFSIHQNGFRSELFPEKFHADVKREVSEQMIAYVAKILNASLTDGFFHPQLWLFVRIIEDKADISYIEYKK